MTELQPETRYADLTDSRIEYLYYDGSGPVIILLHARGFLPWLWHPLPKE
jgi:lipase